MAQYLSKYELAKQLSEYYHWKNISELSRKNERKYQRAANKLMCSINLMIDGCIHRPEFYRYFNLHEDMRELTLFYIVDNLNKKNIKVKRLKIGETAFIKTTYDLKKTKVPEDFPYEITGKEVKIIRKIGKSTVEIEDIETNKKYIVELSCFGYANAFSYISAIIDSNFRKVRNDAYKRVLSTRFFTQMENPELNEFKTDAEKSKIKEMMGEFIEHRDKYLEKNPIIKPKNHNLFNLKIKGK